MKSHVLAGGTLAAVVAALAVMDQLPARDVPHAVADRAVQERAASLSRVVRTLPPVAPRSRATYGVHRSAGSLANTLAPETLNGVIKKSCAGCHSDQRKSGNLSLANFDVLTAADASPEVAERIIGKLRTGMMPPAGRARPGGDTLAVLTETLERAMDGAAVKHPNPGSRAFQRLNRAEYERSIQDLLGLQVNAESWLPLDTRSANFDNIADVQLPSATTLDAYLDAASDIARLAVGDPKASASTASFKIPRLASQLETADGAPRGTRGGVSVVHNFPADGEYVFTVTLHAIPTGQLYGSTAPFDEKIEVSVNGERMALLEIDRGMSQADPNGMDLRTRPIPVKAGPQRITAAFVRTYDGPVNDNIAPIGHSIADTQIGSQGGVTIVSHMQMFAVTGPYNPTGVSETPSRKRIFSCRPTAPAEARPCAEKIVGRLGAVAYRRPLTANDSKALMAFYDAAAKDGGFEVGIRTALEAMLASPHFVFRMEEVPTVAKGASRVAVADLDLASRLSFFLWGAPPDSALVAAAKRGGLSDTSALLAQARRMLKDPRAEALSTRFAAQWLRLQDLSKVHPDALQFPDYHEQLADDMRQETERFFQYLVRENRPLLELYTANYSFMNERLARHYGVDGIVGSDFRKVQYPDTTRLGILGHGSVLTLTSVANRTSPVLRGKWVMEVLMGSPPPPPPPNVPDLEKTGDVKDGRMLTTRERMEQHRSNPSCKSCHAVIDPIGLALDNFDVTGRWRIRENGAPLDTRGDYYDGTRINNLGDLTRVMLKRPVPLVRAYVANLMAYAMGRRVEYYDQAAIRRIESSTRATNYRMTDLILGVVKSDAFRMRRVAVAQTIPGAGTPGTTRGQ
ncbi:MAG: DUF1592 domain-containing protein [Gemmatimonadaceae bacterium]